MAFISPVFLWAASAHAFCGTYVGDGSSTLLNQGSQIALVRQDGRTTLTMANDYQGPLQAFAMLVPVPAILEQEDVRTVDPALLNRLDAYSAPRLVAYTCEDFYYDDTYPQSSGMACGDKEMAPTAGRAAPPSGEDALQVTVENEFQVGIYDIVILSAEDSGDLVTWLDREGYGVSPDAEAMLADYIQAGSYFFAAKVTLGDLDAEGEGAWLEPLQFSYASDAIALPIRLGTLNSPGEQDLVVFVVNEAAQGAAAISNYPSMAVEDECMWRATSPEQTIADHYEAAFSAAWDEAAAGGGAAWAQEYSWNPGGCDPCPEGGALTDADVAGLGFEGAAIDAHFTRLHVRYTPEAAGQDLMLYLSNQPSAEQVRYIQYLSDLEDMFPICGEGWVPTEEAGSCWDDEEAASASGRRAGSSRAALLLATFAAGIGIRRRQRGQT